MYHCRDTFQCLATLNHIHLELLDAATSRTCVSTNAPMLDHGAFYQKRRPFFCCPVALLLVFNCIGSFHAIDKVRSR